MRENLIRCSLLIAIACLLVKAGLVDIDDGQPGPGPVVSSPFPPEGKWLLLAGQADQLSGLELVGNAANVRQAMGEGRRWCDYDKKYSQPWQTALDWANEKSGGKPYYIARQGAKASEGPLAGPVNEMHATITRVVEGLD